MNAGLGDEYCGDGDDGGSISSLPVHGFMSLKKFSYLF
jgi:hypothetical protein